MEYEAIETDIGEMDHETLSCLRFTGTAALEHLMGEKYVSEQDGVVAYSELEPSEEALEHRRDFPEGSQDLYVVYSDYTPSATPVPGITGNIKVVDVDTVVEDHAKSNPRKFSHDLREKEHFRDFVRSHVSSIKWDHVRENYDLGENV